MSVGSFGSTFGALHATHYAGNAGDVVLTILTGGLNILMRPGADIGAPLPTDSTMKKAAFWNATLQNALKHGAPKGYTIAKLRQYATGWTAQAKTEQQAARQKARNAQQAAAAAQAASTAATTGMTADTTGMAAMTAGASAVDPAATDLPVTAPASGMPSWAPYAAAGAIVLIIGAVVLGTGSKAAPVTVGAARKNPRRRRNPHVKGTYIEVTTGQFRGEAGLVKGYKNGLYTVALAEGGVVKLPASAVKAEQVQPSWIKKH